MEDVIGKALLDYHQGKTNETLYLHNNYGSTEEMPVDIFFRGPEEFPELEHIALALCDGLTLDVGAGVGSHALVLQEKGMEVHALEKCAAACAIMVQRGVRHVIHGDFFDDPQQQYDTLLFMMNGIGIAGSLENLADLLEHCKKFLKPGGQLLFDSSDISYLYKDGTIAKPAGYYGEVGFQYEYKGEKGTPFAWLYVDQDTLIALARAAGWVVQILFEDGNDQYLARMELQSISTDEPGIHE